MNLGFLIGRDEIIGYTFVSKVLDSFGMKIGFLVVYDVL